MSLRHVAACVCVSVLIAGSLSATLVQKMELKDLVAGADWIVEAKCTRVENTLDKRGMPSRKVTLHVSRGWRGQADGADATFVVPGGEYGGETVAIAGMPAFEAGDEMMLFLSVETHRGIRVPVGLGQGRLRLLPDAKSKKKVFERSVQGLEIVDPKSGKVLPAAADERLDYDTFIAAVDAAVRDAAKNVAPKGR